MEMSLIPDIQALGINPITVLIIGSLTSFIRDGLKDYTAPGGILSRLFVFLPIVIGVVYCLTQEPTFWAAVDCGVRHGVAAAYGKNFLRTSVEGK